MTSDPLDHLKTISLIEYHEMTRSTKLNTTNISHSIEKVVTKLSTSTESYNLSEVLTSTTEEGNCVVYGCLKF